jgi:hypothetical protein
MTPPADRALEGRVNPKGIPCLYLATTKEAAMSEVRPWIGSYVSVAQFRTERNLKIIDCSVYHAKGFQFFWKEPPPRSRERAVWIDIDRAFSKPVTRADDTPDYVSTQIIAEMFRAEGFDGIVYKSAFGEDGYNLALFDLDAATLINCQLFVTKDVEFQFEPEDNPYFISAAKRKSPKKKI